MAPARHHHRILRAGNLPPGTSPADPRYVQAKRELERQEDRHGRRTEIAALVALLALIVAALVEGVVWLAVVIACLLVITLVRTRKGGA